MLQLASKVTTRLGRRLLARASARGSLANVTVVPRSLRYPLLRNGLDPVPQLATIRDAEQVTHLARFFGRSIWLVPGHRESLAVLADTTSYSNDVRPMIAHDQAGMDQYIGGLGFTDPPVHTRLRKLLTPEFTMHRLRRLEPRINEIVHERLDVLEEQGPVVDLVELFAFPIPFLVICELLGLPAEELAGFQELGRGRFDISKGGVGAFGAVSESREILIEAARRLRANPNDGLIGRIIAEHGDEITDLELGGLADGVFTGGYETTASTLALGSLLLLQDKQHFARLAADPSLADRTVEEMLRYLTVVQIAFPRFALADMELYGHQIKAGDVVICSLSGANRDARLGAEMERFQPTRPPSPHIAFGYGFHRCVGAELARMELRAAFPALARRFPDLSLAVHPSELMFRDLSIVYAVDKLPVRLR
ncbi:MAG: cytochrome P450 [Propionibacteriales bacterium]|nr:cytochrome P450 [Propionibacteriales bacterium]